MTVGRAIALGLVQGPTELLPVSSSAHLTIVPWFAGWGWERIDPGARKAFDVALHGGAALALVIGQRSAIAAELRSLDVRRAAVLALSVVPPGVAGLALERLIEQRLGGPRVTAAGLVSGSAAMVLADRRPQERGHGGATPLDGLALGVAQAAALIPGISRNGATLTAARLRRFTRAQASFLSRTVALPVIAAAAMRKAARLAQGGPRPEGRVLAAGIAASFASTLASQALIRVVERDPAPLWPYGAYRVALAVAVLARVRRG